MNMLVEVSRSAAISRHIASLCAEASDATYTRTVDVESWVTLPGRFLILEVAKLNGTVEKFIWSNNCDSCTWKSSRENELSLVSGGPDRRRLLDVVREAPNPASTCREAKGMWSPCTCRLETCIGWYPCGLKYCRAKDGASYRCGIRTCRKCHRYSYYVRQKQLCLWDEWQVGNIFWFCKIIRISTSWTHGCFNVHKMLLFLAFSRIALRPKKCFLFLCRFFCTRRLTPALGRRSACLHSGPSQRTNAVVSSSNQSRPRRRSQYKPLCKKQTNAFS